ncbi:hypothetical protein I656_00994 [Geobacillus sp. WSUCF1]|nr:hypothetical protein I656_00994 [Geobacillus sp. WSUCF1]GAJ57154.1 hypothetical protein B23_0343 [Geobacillus thermoleovorans B23]
MQIFLFSHRSCSDVLVINSTGEGIHFEDDEG